MLTIVVRSKKDADAVRAMLSVFYRDWGIDVQTLQGARRFEEALRRLEEIISSDRCRLYIVLLGREDRELAEELRYTVPPNVVIHVVPRSKVRNARIEQLAHELDIARAKFRLGIVWNRRYSTYILSYNARGEELEAYEYNPAYDSFLLMERGISILNATLGIDLPEAVLMVRKFGGEHDIYSGPRRIAKIKIPDDGLDIYGELYVKDYERISLSNLISENRIIIELYENIAKTLLKRFQDDIETVVVPWSGGKDSTIALLLALDVFSKDKIKVVYVDTGVEFPQTIEYVERLAERLGIDVIYTHAHIDKAIDEGMPMPTHSNRWCTGRKIEAIETTVRRLALGKTLVIVGDRDAESESRANRPFIRYTGKLVYVAPIKFWGTIHTQLYVMLKNIEINPLYSYGFYRIGCYICPSLRSWELKIMLTKPEILKSIKRCDLLKRFLELKGIRDTECIQRMLSRVSA